MNNAIKYILALLIIAVVILILMIGDLNRSSAKRDALLRDVAEESGVEIEGYIEAMFED